MCRHNTQPPRRGLGSRVAPILAALAMLCSGCENGPPLDESLVYREQALTFFRNVAQGKPATLSSTYQNSSMFAAANAVDGYLSSLGPFGIAQMAHTNYEAQPWLQVDLQDLLFINQVVIYNRTDCCADRLTDFDVMTSTDGTTWQTTSYNGTQPSPLTVNFDRLARYVKIKLRGTGILNLSEVQVLQKTPGRNLAKGMPTSQSSTAYGGEAARAVDGNTDGAYGSGSVTHTDLQYKPWWWVGLGSAQPVSWVVLHNRTDCCAERLSNFTVWVLRADGTWRTISFPTPQTFPLLVPINESISQVSVELNDTGILSLAEVQVLGGEPLNLALGKRVWSGFVGTSASPDFQPNDRAVDGILVGNPSDTPGISQGTYYRPFKVIDLEDYRYISHVAVYNRTDCCGERLRNYSIRLSDDLVNWRSYPSAGVAASDQGSYIKIDSYARYVSVQMETADQYTSLVLSEIRVLGSPVQCPAGQTLLEGKYCVTLVPWVAGTTPAAGSRIAVRVANNYTYPAIVGPWNKWAAVQGLEINANQGELRCSSLFKVTTWAGDLSASGTWTAQDYGFPWFILSTASGTYVKSASSEGVNTGKIWGDADLDHATLFTRGTGGAAAPGLQELGRSAYQPWSPLWRDRQAVMDYVTRYKSVGTRSHTPSSTLLSTNWDAYSYTSNVDFFVVDGAPVPCN
ncbi:MAG: discoidin domain-containing protein [Polyangia bacterium]